MNELSNVMMMKQKQEKEYVNDDEKQMLCFATDKTNCFSDQFNKKNPSTQSNVIYEIQILKMKFYYIKFSASETLNFDNSIDWPTLSMGQLFSSIQ